MTNKGVAEKFKLPVGSLHRITSGRCYAGGHATQKGQGKHREAVVKVSKKKGEKGKTTVTKVSTTGTADYDESTPAEGLRKRRRSNSRGEAINARIN